VTGAVRALVYPVPEVGVVVHAFNIGAATCGWGKDVKGSRVVLERWAASVEIHLQFWIAPNVGREALTYSSERTPPSTTQLAVVRIFSRRIGLSA